MTSFALQSCKSKDKENENTQESVKTVKTVKVTKTIVERTLEYSANILPFKELYMAPAQPGRISKIFVEVGDRVSKGQLIAEMDKTTLNQVELQLSNLEKDYRRVDTLNKVGGIAAQQYDQIKTQLDVTRTNAEFLRENVILKSPFSGLITAKYFESGELYSGAPNTQVGKAAIVVIQQINPVKAIISVSEKYFPVIKKGMQAKLSCDIYPDEEFLGRVSLIHPTINSATKTFNIEIEVPNGSEKLRPGIFSKIYMEVGKEEALVVPAMALQVQEGTNVRYLFVNNNGIAKRIDVEVGTRYDDKYEVYSEDLHENMEIIVAGHTKLLNGDKIKVIK